MKRLTPLKIGIRDLKNRAPQVVREMRETGEAVEITYHGEVVALLTPAQVKAGTSDFKTAWKALDDVAAEIGRRANTRKHTGRKTAKPADWRRDL
jgi:prevent-host-death family protein